MKDNTGESKPPTFIAADRFNATRVLIIKNLRRILAYAMTKLYSNVALVTISMQITQEFANNSATLTAWYKKSILSAFLLFSFSHCFRFFFNALSIFKKKEVGIVGSRVDVERRCEPTCQEYNGNTQANYLIDRVSCCVGNYCNQDVRIRSNVFLSTLLVIFPLGLVFF